MRVKLRRSASFQNLSAHRESPQSLFLSNSRSSELAAEPAAQWGSCSKGVTLR